jgi:hypothetical protein
MGGNCGVQKRKGDDGYDTGITITSTLNMKSGLAEGYKIMVVEYKLSGDDEEVGENSAVTD